MVISYALFFSDEAVRSSATPMTKSSAEMENHVYMKAKTRVSLNLINTLMTSFV